MNKLPQNTEESKGGRVLACMFEALGPAPHKLGMLAPANNPKAGIHIG